MADVRQISPARFLALRSEHIVAQMFWIVTFALATALGAQLEIPHQPIPYTFQTLFVLMAGGMLGWRNGFLSMLFYLGLGVAGAPVFSGAGFGLARLLGPSGGYLLGFPIAAFLIGYLVSFRPDGIAHMRGKYLRILATYGWMGGSMSLGLLVIFLIGTMQLNAVYFHNWTSSFQSGFLIFSWWDTLKLVAATAICGEFRRS